MRKQVLAAAVRGDKAEPLGVVEPFDRSVDSPTASRRARRKRSTGRRVPNRADQRFERDLIVPAQRACGVSNCREQVDHYIGHHGLWRPQSF